MAILIGVIIQAQNADEADRRAEEIGLYFDSPDECKCCGPRWIRALGSEGDGYTPPPPLEHPLNEYTAYTFVHPYKRRFYPADDEDIL